jgi:hypothetical protein
MVSLLKNIGFHKWSDTLRRVHRFFYRFGFAEVLSPCRKAS